MLHASHGCIVYLSPEEADDANAAAVDALTAQLLYHLQAQLCAVASQHTMEGLSGCFCLDRSNTIQANQACRCMPSDSRLQLPTLLVAPTLSKAHTDTSYARRIEDLRAHIGASGVTA